MRKILIIKTGSTLPELVKKQGDFEDWVQAGLGAPADEFSVVDVTRGEPLPDPGEIAGVVVTGSHDMVTYHLVWSEKTAEWLRQAVKKQAPVLGICYGHQLLAYALGGEVDDNPQGREMGTVDVKLNEFAQQDPLLGGLPEQMRLQVCHKQSVLKLPEGARLLATSERDGVQAFSVGQRAWGVQFHPEFNAQAAREYITHYGEALREEGQDPAALCAGCEDNGYGMEILRRFARIVRE